MAIDVQCLALFDQCSTFWVGYQGLYRHGLYDAHIRIFDLAARGNSFARDTVRGAPHFFTIVHFISDTDSIDPFPRRGGGPPPTDQSQWKTVCQWNILPVHGKSEQGFILKCFPNWNAPGDRFLIWVATLFQTRLTKETVNERIRSPMGMWTRNETYIDNNLQNVINRLHEYYK